MWLCLGSSSAKIFQNKVYEIIYLWLLNQTQTFWMKRASEEKP